MTKIIQQIAWLPLCGGLTGVGLVLSWFAWRRRGAAAGLRGVAWSLLPMAAYLTGAVTLITNILVAVFGFGWHNLFSIEGWAGIVVAGLAVLLFFVSGGMRRWRRRKDGTQPAATPAAAGAAPSKQIAQPPVKATAGKKRAAADDDEFSDVAAILKRHGIN